MEYKYMVLTSRYGERDCYGIAVTACYDDESVILESVADLCTEAEPVERLVDACNSLQLDPIHLYDVIDDFLAEL